MTQGDWYDVLSRVNLDQLLLFLWVVEERSFRMAGLRMHISQCAVSVQVEHLECALASRCFTEPSAARA